MRFLAALTLASLLVIAPATVWAAAPSSITLTPDQVSKALSARNLLQQIIQESYTPPAGLIICTPQYYKFASVEVPISGSLKTASPGATITFTGTIQNNNPYPLVDASVYVKIFRQASDSAAKNDNGPDVVDFYTAATGINLNAGEQKQVTFTWKVPADEEPGSYQAATYVSTLDRFDFLGLTFTDDVTGNSFNFNVVGPDNGAVRFDKTGETVNNTPYIFAVFPQVVSSTTKDVPVTATIANTSGLAQSVTVHWSLYKWDTLRPSELLNQQDQTVTVPAHGTAHLNYTITDDAHPVYQLLGTFETKGGSQSIIGMRVERSGIEEPRLQIAGVTTYPTTSTTQAYACLENEGIGYATNTKVVVTTHEDGIAGLFHPAVTKTYTGTFIGTPFYGLTEPVQKGMSSFTVTADLYHNGTQLDHVVVPYSCSVFHATCNIFETWVPLVVLIGLLMIVVFIIVVVHHRKHSAGSTNLPPV